MRKLLMTGFDAFGGESVNPASRAVERLEGKKIGDIEIITKEIPTVFGKAAEVTREEIDRVEPDIVINVGQSGGIHAMRIERLAVNIDDARIKDNEGNQPSDEPIAPGGPLAYWATIPVKDIVARLEDKGIPAFVSYTAGTFVCNHVFYATTHYVKENDLPIQVGFIHVPFLPEQVVDKKPYPVPSMSEETIARALEVAVEAIAEA